ncbi:MAG: HEAT repeat domain-containing protein [candidate division WOR-3 bacterium]|nr:HEAT repeat domain-containing protein [candidate division WOR-3 bacterium]
MNKKALRWLVLVPFVLGIGSNTQAIGQRVEEHKTQADTTKKFVSVEETMKELVEKGIRNEKLHVPELIEELRIAIPDTSAKGSGIIWRLEKSRDLRALPVLCEALLNANRAILRTEAASAIAYIEDYNKDTTALPILREALRDSVTDVKLHAALSLVFLGDKIYPLEVLTALARGENMENWTVDWGGYMGLENATDEEIKKQKEYFKETMRRRAIETLGIIGTEASYKVLKEIISKCSDESIHYGDKILNVSEYAKEVFEKAQKGDLPCKP